MTKILNFPRLIFLLSLVVLWLSTQIGAFLRRLRPLSEEDQQDLDIVLAAALTLLSLIIGFSFSMAISRYDQRKNYEEAEANAIGTEYVRASLLPAGDAAKVRGLLKEYTEQRILFYTTREQRQLEKIDADTAQLQKELWSVIQAVGNAQPTPVVALAVSGMNDVLNSQGYTQAAWRNRLPVAAWQLMATLALFCALLVGYRSHGRRTLIFLVLPLAVSISFLLIADIESPRGGLIRVLPQNLVSLSESLHAQ